MADTPLKSVRARKIVRGETGSGKNGELDLKVSVYVAGFFKNKRRVEVTDASGNKIPGKDPIEYTTNGRYSDYEEIDYIRDYLDTQAKLGGASANTVVNGKEVPVYQILQDPWESGVPLIRDFGYDPYFFNNGVKVQIYWFFDEKTPVGTYSDVFDDNKVKTRYKSTLIPDGGPEWCEPREREISRLERSSIIRGTFSEFGGAFIKPNEITKFDIVKTVKLIMPDGNEYGIAYLPESERKSTREREIDELVIVKYSDKKRYETIKEGENTTDYEYYRRDRDDWNLLNNIKELYCLQLERNKFIKNQYEYDLELCKPDYESCKLIEFKDPLTGKVIDGNNKELEKKTEDPIKTTDNSKTNAAGTKIKLNVQIPNEFKVSANKDLPLFKIFVGDIPVETIYREEDPISEEDFLDEEFQEIFTTGEDSAQFSSFLDDGPPELNPNNPPTDNAPTNNNNTPTDTTTSSTTSTTTEAPTDKTPKTGGTKGLRGKVSMTLNGFKPDPAATDPMGKHDVVHWTHKVGSSWHLAPWNSAKEVQKQKLEVGEGEKIPVYSGKDKLYGYLMKIKGRIISTCNSGKSGGALSGNSIYGKGSWKANVDAADVYICTDSTIFVGGKAQPVDIRAPFEGKVTLTAPSFGIVYMTGTGKDAGKHAIFMHCVGEAFASDTDIMWYPKKKDGGIYGSIGDAATAKKEWQADGSPSHGWVAKDGFETDFNKNKGKTFNRGEFIGFYQGNCAQQFMSGGTHLHIEGMTIEQLDQYVKDVLQSGWYDDVKT